MIKNLVRRFGSTNSSGDKTFLVRYSYIDDVHYKRIPWHKKHIDLVEKLEGDGVKMFGGSLFPNTGACLYFQCDAKETVEKFVENDPFVVNKLVSMWEIEEIEVESKKKIDDLCKDYSYMAM